ncbi:hypothetical protein ThvES_00006440 [Thiovulum sp. ES]|nr:hypothetical protein ThvES_00006440 [Thiovulum sp. ES]
MKNTFSIITILTAFSGCISPDDCETETEIVYVEVNNTIEINTTIEIEKTSNYLHGIAIDGYLQGATVQIGSYETETDENGTWNLNIPSDINLSGEIIQIYGGIDSDTGDEFEGVLKTPFENFDTEIISTPLSTLVSSLVRENVPVETAYQKVGEIVGIDPKNLRKNHFELLDENISDGLEIAKNALLLQKGVEIVSENLNGDSFDFELLQKGIAKAILSDENLSIQKILREPEKIIIQLGATPEAFRNFDLSKDSISFIADEVEKIDFIDGKDRELSIREQSKVIDLMSEEFERFVRDENDENLSIEDIEKNLIVFGGVEGIVEKIDFDEKNSDLIDSFFSKDIVKENVDSYDILKDFGLEDDDIRHIDEHEDIDFINLNLEEADIEQISDEVQKIKDRFPEIPETEDSFPELPRPTEEDLDNTFYTEEEESRILY